jgi:hypothetical protein
MRRKILKRKYVPAGESDYGFRRGPAGQLGKCLQHR